MHVQCTLSFQQTDIVWISASRWNQHDGLARWKTRWKERQERGTTHRRQKGAWNDLWAALWILDTRMCQNLVVEGILLVAPSPPCAGNVTRRISGPMYMSRHPRWEDGYPCVSPMTPGKRIPSHPFRQILSCSSVIRTADLPEWISTNQSIKGLRSV